MQTDTSLVIIGSQILLKLYSKSIVSRVQGLLQLATGKKIARHFAK